MSRLSPTSASSQRRLLALLFALVLAAAACGGSSDVASDEATQAEDADEASTDGGDENNADTDESSADEADVAVGVEDDAMGEDDAMTDDVDTTVAPADEAPTAGSTTDTDLGSADLDAAFAAGTSDRFSLPFMYLTVDQDCDGCADTMSLYYVPSEAKPSILTLSIAYIDGVAQSDFSAVDPTLQAGDPRRIAEQLADTDASFSIDPVSGAITNWTLDGNTVTMRCLQVDTRPVDLRSELCENSLIG